jgi:tyrosine-protein kinase Etk/Wzc
MSSRASASPDDIQMSTVFEALKRSARWLALLSILLGGATFGILSMMAPTSMDKEAINTDVRATKSPDLLERIASNLKLAQRPELNESAPAFSKKFQLSALVAFASLMFGMTWAVMRALFRRVPPPRAKPASVGDRAEPVLSADPEPLLREITEIDALFVPETAQASISHMIQQTHPVQTPAVFTSEKDIGALAERLRARRPAEGGYRTLITGESEPIVPFNDAVELVKALTNGGAQVILVDWSPSDEGLARTFGLNPNAGLNDLLSGDAGFDDIIQRLPGSSAHAIASGGSMDDVGANIDPDQLNLALDALDEAYDHIVVVGRHDEAKKLFEGIEGRFDAGITVVSEQQRTQVSNDQPGTFLGFEVADIDIICYERQEAVASPVAGRIARATNQRLSHGRVAQRA